MPHPKPLQVSDMEDALTRSGRRRVSVAKEIQTSLARLRAEAVSVEWSKVFKASFMLLFVAYPGAYHQCRRENGARTSM